MSAEVETVMGEKVLIVDDEREIADLVELYLLNEGYSVFKFYCASDALKCIDAEQLDLAILDVMLPEVNGLTICKKIREQHTYPVIMLTARDAEVDKITGLTLGADDYVTKPFLPLELVARVKAHLRRYKTYRGVEDIEEVSIGSLYINAATRECTLDGAPLQTTPTEFSILWLLGSKRGQVMSSEDISKAIWKDEYFDKGSSAISVHIRHLREKMGVSFENPRYIKTVWGVGYKVDDE